jgi:hypothetical protein
MKRVRQPSQSAAVLLIAVVFAAGGCNRAAPERTAQRPAPSNFDSFFIQTQEEDRFIRTNQSMGGSPQHLPFDSAMEANLGESPFLSCWTYQFDENLKKFISTADHLKYLAVDELSAEDFIWICELERLEGLSVRNLKLQPEEFRKIEQLSKLRWLVLVNVHFVEATDWLPILPELDELHLNGYDIVDADLPSTRHLPKLRKLVVYYASVTDEGIQHIAENFPHLEVLCLYGCRQITAKSADSLATLQELRALDIGYTPLVEQSRILQTAMPHCKISTWD